MAEYLIFNITGQQLRLKSGSVIYSDTISYIGAKFRFTDEWNGLTKVLHFQKDGDSTVYDITITEDVIEPATNGMNLASGVWQFWVHGNDVSNNTVTLRITTGKVSAEVKQSGVLNGQPLPVIASSVAEQILSKAAYAEQNAITSAAVTVDSTSGNPSASVSFDQQTSTGKRMKIDFTGLKGGPGAPGAKGDPGEKGDTGNGIASITKTGTVGLVDTYTITYTNGTTTTFSVTNGEDGDDGLTPTFAITSITGGHRITITTGSTVQTVDIMDGAKGDPGPTEVTVGGVSQDVVAFDSDPQTQISEKITNPSGGTTGQVLTKTADGVGWQTPSAGTVDFDELTNRPSYNGAAMTHTTSIPEVKTEEWDGKVDKRTTSGQKVYGHNGTTQNELGVNQCTVVPIVTNVSSASTDAQLPSAKCVYDGLEGKLATSLKGSANGLAELDAGGKVPSSQLPAYVDDVLEFDSIAQFPATGESGKIYVAKDTNKTYRWGGSAYVEISPSLALGETSSTAYRGDRGKIAYDHSQATGNPHNTTLDNLGVTATASELNVLDGITASTTELNYVDGVTSGIQTQLDAKVDKVTGKGLSTNDYDNTEKQKVTDSYSARHSHDNLSVLNGITSLLVGAWNGAVTWITTNGATILSHLSDAVAHITSSERTKWNGYESTITTQSTEIANIEEKIPTEATSSNQLADKAYVDSGLDGKVSPTDYATYSYGGTVKIGTYGLGVTNDGFLYAINKTYAQYREEGNNCAISKGCLENVLAAKNINDVTEETWTFTLSDNTTVTKVVKVGS